MKGIIKAVSLDIEGCLTELGGGRVPWPTQKIALLASFLSLVRSIMGIQFFINSGRQAPFTEAVLQALGLVSSSIPSIAENGAVLYFPETKVWKPNPAITEKKEMAFREVERKLAEIVAELGGVQELGKNFSFSTNPPPGMSIEDYFKFIQEALLKIEVMEQVEVTHSQSAIDITIKGVNKKSGLKFWCRETGIKLEELAGIGDSWGDFPVLEVVGMPMCPSNATDDVKKLVRKRGGYISCHNTALGVMDCVARLSKHSFIQKTSDKIIWDFLLHHPIELYSSV